MILINIICEIYQRHDQYNHQTPQCHHPRDQHYYSRFPPRHHIKFKPTSLLCSEILVFTLLAIILSFNATSKFFSSIAVSITPCLVYSTVSWKWAPVMPCSFINCRTNGNNIVTRINLNSRRLFNKFFYLMSPYIYETLNKSRA